jgi:hypothetical protein
MSLLSSFVATQFVKALEEQFLSHMPEVQQAFLNEVAALVKIVSDWIESKINMQGALINEKK